MDYNTIGTRIESPKPHANTAECVKIGHGGFTFFRGQHEDSSICKIAIPVRLSHASSPTIQLDLKSTHSGMGTLNKVVSSNWLAVVDRLLPRDSYEISDAKSIDCDLPSAGSGQFVSPMMQCNVLAQVGPGKLNRKPGFSRRTAQSTSRQVPLGLTKSNLWHLKHCWAFHNINIQDRVHSCHPKSTHRKGMT